MNIDINKTAAITGYEISKILETSLELNLLTNLMNRLTRVIKELYDSGYSTFISDLNEGFEMMAAESVVKLKNEYPDIKLIAVIQYPGYENQFSSPDKYRYKRIIEDADKSIIISKVKTKDTQQQSSKFILSNSSLIMCYSNGKPYRSEEIYNEALQTHMPIINLCETMVEDCL